MMNIVILDAMECENPVSSALSKQIGEKGYGMKHFHLSSMDIAPCRSCGACAFRSPGRCIIDDAMHSVMEALAKCDTIIMLTPIRFGGYSSHLKKAVDRFMNLCLPTYTVKKGHLLHPPRYGSKYIIGIGVCEAEVLEPMKSFTKLVQHNALNMQSRYEALIVTPDMDEGNLVDSFNGCLERSIV